MRTTVASLLLVGFAMAAPLLAVAQDTTPPGIVHAAIRVETGLNGAPLTLHVDAEVNEPATFDVVATYASSYPRFLPQLTEFYAFKTAAQGVHQEISEGLQTVLTDFQMEVGPRCYHSDTLRVSLWAKDASGNRSAEHVLHDALVDIPLPPAPTAPAGDGYAVATHWNGSRAPSDHNRTTIQEWSRPDFILCTPAFFFEGPQTAAGWDHWIHRIRQEPGSNNIAAIGFASLTAQDNPDYPVNRRLYHFFRDVHDNIDDNVLVHLADGSLPDMVDGYAGKQVINIFSPLARDTLAWFYAVEWNHCENRQPRVGLMFDVYEYWTEYAMNGEWAAWVMDRDRDGIPMNDDPDEQLAARIGRIEFLRSMRRHIAATSTDPEVGNSFLLGANTVSGRSDAELLAECDFLLIEDIQCPPGGDTEYRIFDGEGCYDEHQRSIPYHAAAAEDFRRQWCEEIYYHNDLIDAGVIPNPIDISQSWRDLPDMMRSQAGGPFIAPESQGSGNDLPVHPGALEAFSLLFDHIYPIWHNQEDLEFWRRSFWHPDLEGLPDLHDIGSALGPMTTTSTGDNSLLWQRLYTRGSVEIAIADTSQHDCEAGDVFEYRVTVDGETVRMSPTWGDPVIEAFFVADWDTFGVGGAVRMELTALANEPVAYELALRPPGADWTVMAIDGDRREALGYVLDTGLPPMNGVVDVRLRGLDLAGLATPWLQTTVDLARFESAGIDITDVTVLGTAYGAPGTDGGYVPVGLGEHSPNAAPPHYLRISGSTSGDFVPAHIEWSNSLGGSGTAPAANPWVIELVPLHRGNNEIVIRCIDADEHVRQVLVPWPWDYPGAPGRQR